MTIQWNKVTWYSKLLAVIIFVATFVMGFCLGKQYESTRYLINNISKSDTVLPSTDKLKELTFTLSVGEEKVIPSGVIKLESVDDSRCPTDVQCIWAGTVRAHLIFSSSNQIHDVTVEIGKKAVRLSDYDVSLMSVSPAKQSGGNIRYNFTFHIKPTF